MKVATDDNDGPKSRMLPNVKREIITEHIRRRQLIGDFISAKIRFLCSCFLRLIQKTFARFDMISLSALVHLRDFYVMNCNSGDRGNVHSIRR